jgi:hypothetical protein
MPWNRWSTTGSNQEICKVQPRGLTCALVEARAADEMRTAAAAAVSAISHTSGLYNNEDVSWEADLWPHCLFQNPMSNSGLLCARQICVKLLQTAAQIETRSLLWHDSGQRLNTVCSAAMASPRDALNIPNPTTGYWTLSQMQSANVPRTVDRLQSDSQLMTAANSSYGQIQELEEAAFPQEGGRR